MHKVTKKRRMRQPSSTAVSSAWLLKLLQLCSNTYTAPMAQAAHHHQQQSSQEEQSSYLRKSRRRQLQSSSNISYFTFSPSDDATIYSSETALSNYDTLHQLIFAKNSSNELNALLKFDLTFINHKSSSELSSATLHLCNSFDSGGSFDPQGVNIYGVSASYFSGGGDWSESTVKWDHSPQIDISGGKAKFVESHKDEHCFWHTFSVTNLVRSTLDDSSVTNDLTLRITGEHDQASMYVSKEFEEGNVAPRLDVYFSEVTDTPTPGPTPQPSTAQSKYPRPTTSPTKALPTPQAFNGCSFNDEIVPGWSSEHFYDAADLVTNYNKVYECKPHPFSGWCNDYEPGLQNALPGSEGVSVPWSDAWFEKADCVEMMYTQEGEVMEVMEDNEGHLTGSKFTSSAYDSELCATKKFREGKQYAAQDQVLNQDAIYVCNEPGWCSEGGYQPGLGLYWKMAWTLLHEALGCPDVPYPTYTPTLMPTIVKEICAPRYSAETEYEMFDIVSHENYNYRCHVVRWCNDGNGLNAAAWWQMSKPCETSQPTLHPTPPPMKAVVTRPPKTQPTLTAPTTSAPTTLAPTTLAPTTLAPTILAPTSASPTQIIHCAPPYTVGHNYKFMEEISFNFFNYACYVPTKCNQIMYAPRVGDDNMGVAWWKTDECVGSQTRHPTVLPTPRPTYPQREESAYSTAHDEFYTNAIPENVAGILVKAKTDIEQNVLVRRTPNMEWEASSIYHYDGLVKALGVMTLHDVRSGNFYLGEGMGDVAARYGLVNLAAFLAHSMAQSIKYDICDEPNWEQVNGKYPLSNACGQGGKSYQDMTCPEDERHMECPVKTSMSTRAVTHANWGSAPGAPTHLFCQPKSTDDSPFTGFWDPKYKCDRPYGEPPEFCDVYEGQTAGRIDASIPAANMAARIDVEGCCWWGRGVLQSKGVCSIGRLNYFLGKGAADAGRPSPYPNVDLCDDPEVICGSAQHSELKWVAGMAEWVDQVQSYDKDGYSYLNELKQFVNGGMNDDSFINSVSKILQHGCHGDDTLCHSADGAWERMDNFRTVLKLFRLEIGEVVAASSATSPTVDLSAKTGATSPVDLSSFRLTPAPTTRSPTMHPSPRPNPRNPRTPVEPVLLTAKPHAQPNQELEEAGDELSASGCPPHTTGWYSPDCKSFFMCKKGEQIGTAMACGEGFLFDKKSNLCRPGDTVNCDSLKFQSHHLPSDSEYHSKTRPIT